MIVSVLIIDYTEKPEAFYMVSECELIGCQGDYHVEITGGNKIPITDDAFNRKLFDFDKATFGNSECLIVLHMGSMDETAPQKYSPIGINLNNYK